MQKFFWLITQSSSMFIGKESVMKPKTICLACEHVILTQTNQKLCKKLANYKRLYMSVVGFKHSTCIVHKFTDALYSG